MRAALRATLTGTVIDSMYQTIFSGPNIAGTDFWLGASGVVNRTNGTQISLPGFRSGWMGIVKATGASLMVVMSSGETTGTIEVSVDGSLFNTVSIVSGRAQLFTGLSDVAHKVVVRPKAGYGDAIIGNASNVLVLTGIDTYATMAITWAQVGSSGNWASATLTNSHGLSGYTPTLTPAGYNTATYGSNTPSVTFVADCIMLMVLSKTQKITAIIGNAPSVIYNSGIPGGNDITAHFIQCSPGAKRYTISAGASNVLFPIFSVGVVGNLKTHGTVGVLDQFGDSITEGNRYVWGSVETFGTAHQMLRAGETFGISGDNVQSLKTRLQSTTLARSSQDVAVIAIGVNDVGSGWSTTKTGYYTDIINDLLARGYGRVLCRHMLPTTADYSAVNAGISAAVAACADLSRARVINTSSWPHFSAIQVDLDEGGGVDGLHLSDPEYAAAVPYCVSAYNAALAS